MRLSYAQHLEDYHLDLIFADQPAGTYVDIGGGHPVADNVTFHLYLQGWSGIVVEPQDELADMYAHIRPRDRLVRDLVGAMSGPVEFFKVDRLHGLSTTIAAHAEGAAKWGAGYVRETRSMTTLADLCRSTGLKRIDLLKIDVEGAEADVIEGGDWTAFRPRVVVVEATVPGSDVPAWTESDARMLARDYRFVLFDGLNRFYVAADADHLADRLPEDPAAGDIVPRLGQFGRAGIDPNHPDHALARLLPPDLLPELCRRPLADLLPALRAALPKVTDAFLASEEFAAVRGRIAAHYDGGLIVGD
jgi:FkbM family methyltransferase